MEFLSKEENKLITWLHDRGEKQGSVIEVYFKVWCYLDFTEYRLDIRNRSGETNPIIQNDFYVWRMLCRSIIWKIERIINFRIKRITKNPYFKK